VVANAIDGSRLPGAAVLRPVALKLLRQEEEGQAQWLTAGWDEPYRLRVLPS
jgi:hypothetical protein